MDILVITSIYPEPESYEIASDTKVVHYFTRYWAGLGHRVIVIHPYYNALKNIKHALSNKSGKIVHTEIDNVKVIYGKLQLFVPHSLYPAKWRQRILAKKMRNYLERNFPDFIPEAVSVHFPVVLHSFISSFLHGENSVGVFHGTDTRLIGSRKVNCKTLIEELDKTYKLFLFRSPKLLSTGINYGFDVDKSYTLISGLKPSLIADKEFINKKINSNSDFLKLIFAGNLVRQKRIDQIIKALSLLKQDVRFKFEVVGDGSERTELEVMTRREGLEKQITFHGNLSRDEVSILMGESDAFIMTSSNETLGLVYLEAMAQGCITIGSKGEGIDGIIVNNENGFLVDPNNIADIAKCIQSISRISKDKKREIINNAYDKVKGLTDTAISEEYLSILKSISTPNSNLK